MSSGMIGMDTADVRVLANNIRTQADRINSVVSNVDGIVHQLVGAWSGTDATEFAGWWQQQHRPALVSVEQLISGLAQSADNRAHEQDQTSAATGTSPAGGAGAVVGGAAGAAGAAGAVAAGAAGASTGAGSAAGSVSSSQQQAMGWAEGQLKNPDSQYNGANTNCYEFVQQAYGGSQGPLRDFPTAQDAYTYYSTQPGFSTVGTPPPGAVVFYSGAGGDGHAALSVGNGQVICTQYSTHAPYSSVGVVEIPYTGAGGHPPMSAPGAPSVPSEVTYEGWYLPPAN